MDVRDKAKQTVSTHKKKTVVPKCARQHSELNFLQKKKTTVDAGGTRLIVLALQDPYLKTGRRLLSLWWSNLLDVHRGCIASCLFFLVLCPMFTQILNRESLDFFRPTYVIGTTSRQGAHFGGKPTCMSQADHWSVLVCPGASWRLRLGMCVSIFFLLNPPFRDQCFLSRCISLPILPQFSKKKREGHSAEMQKKKKQTNTTVLNKRKRTTCVFQMLVELSVGTLCSSAVT